MFTPIRFGLYKYALPNFDFFLSPSRNALPLPRLPLEGKLARNEPNEVEKLKNKSSKKFFNSPFVNSVDTFLLEEGYIEVSLFYDTSSVIP